MKTILNWTLTLDQVQGASDSAGSQVVLLCSRAPELECFLLFTFYIVHVQPNPVTRLYFDLLTKFNCEADHSYSRV